MKISETTSFAYPVLAPWSDDIIGATIAAEIKFREDEDLGQVSIHFAATLDQPEIVKLIQLGEATFGCFIKCVDTGVRRLQPLSFPNGVHHFAPGALLGQVHIRPMVWTVAKVENYSPAGRHTEYRDTFTLGPGAILAMDDEQIIEVSRPPLPSVESIFEIKASDDIPEGEFQIDTQSERVTVRMHPETFQLVQQLRIYDESSRAALYNGLYVPMLVQLLQDVEESGYEAFEKYRWLHPFRAQCEKSGVSLEKKDFFNDAQRLLLKPFRSLVLLTDGGSNNVDVGSADAAA